MQVLLFTDQTAPVLFIVFNRPDLARRTFEQIRQAKPSQLFIAADGPRMSCPEDKLACAQSRKIVEQVDWNCDVRTLFRDQNLGCRNSVSGAISWFFESVEEGIVLEDDCVPDISFFQFATTLLEKYREDRRVMCITGDNFQEGIQRGDASYYFSIYNHCWGWASWRRAWAFYDKEMQHWPNLKANNFLRGFHEPKAAEFWESVFDSVLEKRIDSWAYVWAFSCWANSGLTAIPNRNLVTNIGFDARATHTLDPNGKGCNIASSPLDFPLVHPRSVQRHPNADRHTEKFFIGIQEEQEERNGLKNALESAKKPLRRLRSMVRQAWHR